MSREEERRLLFKDESKGQRRKGSEDAEMRREMVRYLSKVMGNIPAFYHYKKRDQGAMRFMKTDFAKKSPINGDLKE